MKTTVFPFNVSFTAFSLYYFFNSKLFLICFLQFFSCKSSRNFYSFKITNDICSWNSILNFCNNKIFFRPIWNKAFCKSFLLWHFNIITNFKSKIRKINFFTRVNICVWFYINRLHLNDIYFNDIIWYISLYLLTILYNLSI